MAAPAYSIPLDSIIARERARPLDDVSVSRLMDSIALIGMQTPISVRRNTDGTYDLVAGAHRLEACQRLGFVEIDAVEMDQTDTIARLWEISENLHRHDLTALERSAHVAEWVRLRGVLQSDQVEQIESRRADGRGHRRQGGISAAARELGMDRAAVSRALQIDALPPEAKGAAVAGGYDDNQAMLLAAARAQSPAPKARSKREASRPEEAPPASLPTPFAGIPDHHPNRIFYLMQQLDHYADNALRTETAHLSAGHRAEVLEALSHHIEAVANLACMIDPDGLAAGGPHLAFLERAAAPLIGAIRDRPAAGSRCSTCAGDKWWIEAAYDESWTCQTCSPPPEPESRFHLSRRLFVSTGDEANVEAAQ